MEHPEHANGAPKASGNDVSVMSAAYGPGSPVDGNLLTDLLSDVLAHVTSRSRVIEHGSEEETRLDFTEELPQWGAPLEEVLNRCWARIVRRSIYQSHPRYLAFPDSGNAIAGLAAEILIPVLNQNLIATAKSAPTATFAEVQVLWWLRRLIGFPADHYPTDAVDAAGLMVGGGVTANTVALLAARSNAYPEARKVGLAREQSPPAVFIPGDTMSHYSHGAAAWWTGLGEDSLIPVAVQDTYSMCPIDLERRITETKKEGRRAVAIIGQAGDSRTMAIDPLRRIAEIAARHSVWFHLDACHGGTLLFSNQLRHRLNGIELADSVAMDPHKGLCLPYSSSALLLKTPEHLAPLAKSTDITIKKGSYDLGQVTPFAGSRPFESLKLWLLLQHLGIKGVGRIVEHRYQMANHWKSLVDASPMFTTLNNVSVNSVVFSLSPVACRTHRPTVDELGRLNQLVHDRVYTEGDCCVHAFDLRDYGSRLGFGRGAKLRVLGVTLGNPLTDQGQLNRAFETLATHATAVANSAL